MKLQWHVVCKVIVLLSLKFVNLVALNLFLSKLVASL